MRRISSLEARFELQLLAFGIGGHVREYRFSPPRRWMFDFCWPERKIAVELEGGIYSGGRHTRGVGFEKDCEKYNAATKAGWRVLRYTKKSIDDGSAALDVMDLLMKSAA